MTDAGPMFLAAVLGETFEGFQDDEAGELLHAALTRHGYRLVPIEAKETERAALNTAVTGAARRLAAALEHHARDMDRVARAMAAMDVEPGEARRVEDAAWHSIWLNRDMDQIQATMTEDQRRAVDAAVGRELERRHSARDAS